MVFFLLVLLPDELDLDVAAAVVDFFLVVFFAVDLLFVELPPEARAPAAEDFAVFFFVFFVVFVVDDFLVDDFFVDEFEDRFFFPAEAARVVFDFFLVVFFFFELPPAAEPVDLRFFDVVFFLLAVFLREPIAFPLVFLRLDDFLLLLAVFFLVDFFDPERDERVSLDRLADERPRPAVFFLVILFFPEVLDLATVLFLSAGMSKFRAPPGWPVIHRYTRTIGII